jgi:hypothetical protein
MEEWHRIVRNLKDESEDAYITQNFCFRIFHDLKRAKIRDKKKFRERTGSEFTTWSYGLELEFPKTLVMEILNDDDFWLQTLKVAGL